MGGTGTTNPGNGDGGVQPPAESDPAYPSTTTTTTTTVEVPVQYTVQYRLNGGKGEVPEPQTFFLGGKIDILVYL